MGQDISQALDEVTRGIAQRDKVSTQEKRAGSPPGLQGVLPVTPEKDFGPG